MPRPIMFAETQKYAIFSDLLQPPHSHMRSALLSITHNSCFLSARVTETRNPSPQNPLSVHSTLGVGVIIFTFTQN